MPQFFSQEDCVGGDLLPKQRAPLLTALSMFRIRSYAKPFKRLKINAFHCVSLGLLGFVCLVFFYGLYHGKSPSNHHLGEYDLETIIKTNIEFPSSQY